tara:strand:+ start:154 stop:483 length:330 start_codon:yes stop_codon:yes gene_type:complete
MAQTFSKTITELYVVNSYDSKSTVIHKVIWSYIITDDVTDTERHIDCETELSIDGISNFTNYSSLKETDIIAWVEACLTTDEDAKYKTELTRKINILNGGTSIKKFPWS